MKQWTDHSGVKRDVEGLSDLELHAAIGTCMEKFRKIQFDLAVQIKDFCNALADPTCTGEARAKIVTSYDEVNIRYENLCRVGVYFVDGYTTLHVEHLRRCRVAAIETVVRRTVTE